MDLSGPRIKTFRVNRADNNGGGEFWRELQELIEPGSLRLEVEPTRACALLLQAAGETQALALRLCPVQRRFLVGPGSLAAGQNARRMEGLATRADGDEEPTFARAEWIRESAQLLQWIAKGGLCLELWDRSGLGPDFGPGSKSQSQSQSQSQSGITWEEECKRQLDARAFRWSLRRKQRFIRFICGGSGWRRWWPPDSQMYLGPPGSRCHFGPDFRRPWRYDPPLRGSSDAQSNAGDLVNQVPDSEQAVEIPIDGVLDLHHFPPSQVGKIVKAYLDACEERGIVELRLIHGKGKGHLRRSVHSILKKDPRVLDFRLGGLGAGQWGATVATLKKKPASSNPNDGSEAL